MTAGAIGKLSPGDALVQVFLKDIGGLVLVAAITGVFGKLRRMAGLAGKRCVGAMVERERMVFKEGGTPGLGGMAVLALQAKETGMNFGFSVAGDTSRGCIYERLCMAVQTFKGCVNAIQGEEVGMVEIRHAIDAVVAIQASRPKLLQVGLHEERVVLVVAVQAGLGLELIEASRVTGGAAHGLAGVFLGVTGQAEAGAGEVLEGLPLPGHSVPVLGGVAFGAVLAEKAKVELGFCMATGTISWQMLLCSKKILRGLDGSLAGVAGGASQVRVTPFQGKIGVSMVEIGHAVAAIMTGQALVAKFLQVLAHKGGIVVRVARSTIF
jgi:hypothetical protein